MLCVFFSLSLWSNIPDVSILIAKNQKKISISGKSLKRTYLNSKKSDSFSGNKIFKFDCAKKSLALKQEKLFVSLQSEYGKIQWNKNSYPGEFLITSNKNSSLCNLITKLPFEKYIALILTKEMNPSWHIEALKAQAIAARTYALHKLKKNPRSQDFHLENSEKDQVHGSLENERSNSIKAAKQTEGLILLPDSKVLKPIFYHSKCGGKTLLPSDIWSTTIPEYESITCPYCHNYAQKSWSNKVPLQKLSRFFSKTLKRKIIVSKIDLFDSNIFKEKFDLFSAGKTFSLNKALLRKKLGRKILPSNRYSISKEAKHVRFEGKGNGHGVGLCQLGALELAKRGFNHKQILSYYLPNFKISFVNEAL